MKQMISMIKAKKARLATAVLAAAMTMSMAAPMVASAHGVYDEPTGKRIEASVNTGTTVAAEPHSGIQTEDDRRGKSVFCHTTENIRQRRL